MQPIIRVQGLGKQYHLGGPAAVYSTLRETLMDLARKPLRSLRNNGNGSRIWALQNIDFEVMPGEIVGIIGRNGAGKSTLLKILSRITEPTVGRVELYGRVGSLLEVGTGFHPELSGRENIFLNGSILGMTRREIEQKFDEIVAFSEVEKFLDTPVKRYSSGMYVRLAFAVAAHLEPEILIVDEVLAVGDFEFQKKCLGKMDNVAKTGRTVLYVSHSMESITRLCTRVILLENGQIARDGEPDEVVQDYLGRGSSGTVALYNQAVPPKPNQDAWISRVELLDDSGPPRESFVTGEPMRFRISFELMHPCSYVEVGLALTNQKGIEIAAPNSRQQYGLFRGNKGTNTVECRWDGPPLTSKRYHLRVDLGDYHRNMDSVENAVIFQVEAADYFGTGKLPNPNLAVLSKCSWQKFGEDSVE